MNESLAKYYLQSNCTNVSLVYIQGWSLFQCTFPLSFQIMLVFSILDFSLPFRIWLADSLQLSPTLITYALHNQGYPRYAALLSKV